MEGACALELKGGALRGAVFGGVGVGGGGGEEAGGLVVGAVGLLDDVPGIGWLLRVGGGEEQRERESGDGAWAHRAS